MNSVCLCTLIAHRIESFNGQNMSLLYDTPFDFENEMLCCFLQIVGLGNSCADSRKFEWFDTSATSSHFLSALVCCVLEMLYHIANDN